MKYIKPLLIPIVALTIAACSGKQDQLNSQESTEVGYVSEVKVPELESRELSSFAHEYDELINEAITQSKLKDGEVDKHFQEKFEKYLEVAQRKMAESMEDASARDVALFQKYVLAKQQELKEKVADTSFEVE